MKYLEGLNDRQREAVLAPSAPLMVLAGAGAGKTKMLTHRIARFIAEGVPAEAILAVTFTNKAAKEMRERVISIINTLPAANVPLSSFADSRVPTVSTFHSLGVRILREHASILGIPRSFSIWDRADSIRAIKAALTARGLEKRYEAKHVLGRISKSKGESIDAQAFRASAHTPWEEVVAELWEAYDVARFKEGALDFDDLLLSTHALLTNDKEVLSKLQHRWTHLLVDEYQDTNRVQYEIARLLAGTNKNLTVVGDIDQNIYSWRGADIGHLLSFEKTFPGAKVVMLEQNYRSTRTIVGAANGVIARNKNRYDKTLFTENDGGEQIDLYYATGESDEALFVAKTAREYMQKGTPAHEIAVLYRANFQSRALEEAFIKMGVPYRLLGTKFFERSEVKDVLSYLRAALNPQSSGDIARIVASPPRGIGKTTLAKVLEGAIDTLPAASRNKVEVFFSLLARIAECAKTQPVSHTIKFIIRESGLETHLTQGSEEDKERLLNAKELVNLATKYDALEPLAAAEKLLEEAALMTDQDSLMNVEENNAVSLMTVHASKGLEFDVVFITGLEEGLFPYESDDDDRDQEEERRLFYVALTRARKKVYLTSAATRMMFGNRELCTPSQFLSDIEPAYLRAAFGGTTAPERPRRSFDEFGYEEDTIY